MRFALVMLLVACGADVPREYRRINDVACIEGEFVQCVCDRPTCNPGEQGVWQQLGDACVAAL